MAEVVLFHHALGLTPAVQSFAGALRDAGHVVHTPDAYEGVTFADVDAGVDHARSVGFDVVMERFVAAATELPAEVVYVGMSLGTMAAQMLAQTRPGAHGAVLLYSVAPLAEFGGAWPDGVPLQIHVTEDDPWEDVEMARALAADVPGSSLHVYPGDKHLFAEEGYCDHDPAAAAEMTERVLALLEHA